MAKELFVRIRDDLDGNYVEEFETIPFTYRGVAYEIDLGIANVELIDKTMKQFIDVARKATKKKRGKADKPTTQRAAPPQLEQSRRIRAWANEQGYEVSAQGAIAGWILQAWHKQHPDEKMLVHPVKMPHGPKKNAPVDRSKMTKRQRDIVRAWAANNGYEVAARGYIPDEVLIAHRDRKKA